MGIEIVEKIKDFVKNESRKPENWWGSEFYDLHILSVYKYSKMLNKKLGGDLEVIELAALLHDIGSIIEGRKDHHLSGARIAEKKLIELGLDVDKIEKIKHCILSHRGSQNISSDTIEAKIIRDADSLSTFDHITGPFLAAFVYEKRGQINAKNSVRSKFNNSWKKLHFEESKNLIKPKYDALMLLLGEEDE